MKDLRILFMGTPEFAVSVLNHLIEKGYNIIAVVTAPDKPAGRGRKMRSSAVKRYALKQQLPVLQPTNLKDEGFQKKLTNLDPDVAVVVAFRMLPKKVWSLPKNGTFNLHVSLLPDYRGAAPINWAIINGEPQTGVTTFFLDENIDTGEIIKQKTVSIDRKDDAGSLHDKLMLQGAKLVETTLNLMAKDELALHPQPILSKPKEAPKLTKDNTKIDWSAGLEEVYNFVRGLSPYPVAWADMINGEKEVHCKVYAVEVARAEHRFPLGKLIKTKNSLKVAVDEGYVYILEMQMQGKRKMPIKDLLNGLNLKENAKMR